MKAQKIKIHLPIVFKLVFLTSLIVVSVAMTIAWKNSELFSQISTDREETTASMITASKALEVDAILESYVEKLTTLAMDNSSKKNLSGDLAYFKLDTNNANSSQFDLENTAGNHGPVEDFRKTLQTYSSKIALLQNGNVFITSTGTLMKDPYLLIGSPVAKENGFVTHWAWGFFRVNRLQASFEKSKDLSIYLLDERGHVIVHPDENKTLAATDLSQNKFIATVLSTEIRKKQQYLDDTLYSSAKTTYGPMVMGEISQASIMAPARLAKETTYFILGMILSLSFFFSVVFAHTLSKNLEKLTSFAYRIANGDFNVNASKEIRSKDEIGILAEAFDDMTKGLRERDKIKNIFTKFHGSVITDTLMDQEDLRKGKKCEAVIFFSDIRGFTDFSNNKTPEEVVAMLNSYFEVMVAIINKNGGVVDKFVGDAIMAVWGAPNGTPDDAKKALTACLEMRKALAVLNEKRISEGQSVIMMGMGLHAGEVVAGTIGSDDRLEYTVIGDTVNTASRIESSTKAFGTDLLVSEEVVKRVQDMFVISFAGSTKVKGKDEPLRLAKVNGYYDQDMNPTIVSTPYSQYEAEDSDKVKIVA
jgi:adenylate cyclase